MTLFALLLTASAPAARGADECAVFAREASFAASVEAHDAAAFASHLHEGAVFSAATEAPLRGKAAVVEAWKPIVSGERLSLRWRPAFVSIGGDPDIALSRGPFVIADHDAAGAKRFRAGEFSSVWVRKNKTSPWLVLFDGGGPPPAVVAEAEAEARLAAAPSGCASR